MNYTISIYRDNEGLVYEIQDIPTRYDLQVTLDSLLARFPRTAGHEFNVTCTVSTRYTLLDPDVQSGDQVSTKIWDFVQTYRPKTS